MKKIILSLVLMLCLVGAVSATDYYVSKTGNDGTGDGSLGTPWLTIQHAIDTVSSGDTINVAAGTYVEQIIIDKSIALQGASKETTIIEYSPTPVSDQYLVMVQAEDVTITGFKLLGHFATGNRAVYIVHSQETGLIVEDNEIQGFIGIFGNLINGQIRNNIIGTDRKGIYISGGNNVLNLLIEGNTIEPAEGASSYAYNCGAIYMDHANYVTIQGNTMRDFSSSTDSSITAGRCIEGSHNNDVTIFENTFENTRDAITMWIVTDIEIDKNTITNSDRYGINIKGQNINIINNEITGSGNSGVNIAEFTITTQNVNVNFNNIFGNINYGIKNTWSGEVNAEYNWWGRSTGPSGEGTGSGDAASINVDYDSWLCEPAPTNWYSVNGVCVLLDTTPPVITFVEPVSGTTHSGVINLRAECNEVCNYVNFWWRAEDEVFAWYRYHYVHDDGTVFEWGLNTLNAQLADGNSYLMVDGTYYLYAAGKDLAGNWARTPEIQVTIDNTAPIVTIESPTDGNIVSGIVDIYGSIVEEYELSHYNIAIYSGDANFMDFSQRLEQKTEYLSSGFDNEVIYSWDTTAYPDGEYLIRLAARDKAGNRDLSGDPYSGGDDSQHVIRVFVGNTKAGILMYNNIPGKGIANAPGLQKVPKNDNFAKGTVNKK